MPSLTATLLLGMPIQLPAGKMRRIVCEDDANQFSGAYNQEIRLANVEIAYGAILHGAQTVKEIIKDSGLSNCTVIKIIHDLEDTGRILSDRSKFPHRFFAVSE